MTDIIATDFQTQEIDSPVVDLFELTLPSGSTVYFHPGKDDNLDDLQFKDKSPDSNGNYTVRTYTAIPVALDGMEIQADGATSRPTISIANIGTTVLTGDDTLTYNDLIGQEVTKRQTLEKYLVGGSAYVATASVPPVELTSVRYKIDRISSESNIGIVYELAVSYDLEGVQLPRRVVVGKFCSWMYQGYNLYGNGGCNARLDGNKVYENSSGVAVTNVIFSDVDNNFFVDANDLDLAQLNNWSSNGVNYTPESYVKNTSSTRAWVASFDHTSSSGREPGTAGGASFWKEMREYTNYNASTTYSKGALVKHSLSINGKTLVAIFECLIDNSSTTPNRTPALDTPYWSRVDLCGKTLDSCKCKFGTHGKDVEIQGRTLPRGDIIANEGLPFGGFPATGRF